MIDCSRLRLALFSDTYPPQVNGVARTLERLVAAVAERGGTARVYTVADPEAVHEHARENVRRFPSVPFWAYKQLRLAWPLQRTVRANLREFRPTLVHSATEFGIGLSALRAARSLDIPFVSSYHTSFTAYAEFYKLGFLASAGWQYFRWFHNSGLRTYCPTRAIVDEVALHGFRNLRVWSRGVDTEKFSPTWRSAALRAKMGASDDTLVVAYVGRIAAEKGLRVATEAVRRATEERPGRIVFLCVGDGPWEKELRQLAPPNAHIPGRLVGRDLSVAYASADVFLFPSTTDTFGNVMLEAMASGLPVLGADVGPTRELLGEHRGWLVPPADSDAYAAQIVALVDDRTRLAAARAAALQFAAESTWERVWDELLGDYLQVHRALG